MNATTRLLLIALLSLPLLAACQKEEAPAVDPSAAKAPLTRPATNDDAEWGAYLSDVVTRNMGDITRSPYLYYLPASGTPGFEGARARLQEEVEVAMQRGIVEGNLVACGSPESAMRADIITRAFAQVDPGSMDGVRVLFIGDAADDARVKAAVAPAGVVYQFIEAK